MKADDPVYPQSIPDLRGRMPRHMQGLTKREHFAAIAMQSFLNKLSETPTAEEIESCAVAAVHSADWLVEMLNEVKPEAKN